jgi:hypothetical protein
MTLQALVESCPLELLILCRAAQSIDCWVQIDKAQEGTGANHAISALKFKIIQEFLELGWNVLLSDVDVVVVQVGVLSFPSLFPCFRIYRIPVYMVWDLGFRVCAPCYCHFPRAI